MSAVDDIQEIKQDVKWMRDKVVVHEERMEELFGNGRPGTIHNMTKDLEELKQIKWKVVGFVIGLVFLMEASHVGIDKLMMLVK